MFLIFCKLSNSRRSADATHLGGKKGLTSMAESISPVTTLRCQHNTVREMGTGTFNYPKNESFQTKVNSAACLSRALPGQSHVKNLSCGPSGACLIASLDHMDGGADHPPDHRIFSTIDREPSKESHNSTLLYQGLHAIALRALPMRFDTAPPNSLF